MIDKNSLRAIILLPLFLVLVTSDFFNTKAFAQQSNPLLKMQPANTQEKKVKKDGWKVPGASSFTTVAKVKEKMTDGLTVTQKVLEASERVIVDVNGNNVKNPFSKKSSIRLFVVKDFSAYESSGRTFAFEVTLVPIVVEGNRLMYIGAMYNLFYFDEDGDGTFETRYGGLPLPNVPEWVKALNKKAR